MNIRDIRDWRSVVPMCVSITTLGAMCVAGSVLIGCSGDTTGTEPAAATGFYSVVLNQHAINMSLTPPSNTIQLTATVLDTKGEALPSTGVTTFRAIDSSVTVSASGLVTAHYITNSGGTEVIAMMQQDNGTRADTAYIKVTATAPVPGLSTFSLQPPGGGSTFVSANGGQYFPAVVAYDSANQAMNFNFRNSADGLVYWTRSSDPIHVLSQFSSFGSWPTAAKDGFSFADTGHVTLYAGSWVYGVTVQDSLKVLVGWPTSVFSELGQDPQTFSGITYFLGTGGTVVFVYDGGQDDLDIVFDDSTAVDSIATGFGCCTGRGNMHFDKSGGVAIGRSFPVAGTYHFWNRQYPDLAGTIYVLTNPTL